MWTQFMDMHSGGGAKEKWENIFIEAPEKEAVVIFYNRFGHNPHRITCTCCGNDYSISEDESLQNLTAYHRNCRHDGEKYIEERDAKSRDYQTLEEYMKRNDVLFIKNDEIPQASHAAHVQAQLCNADSEGRPAHRRASKFDGAYQAGDDGDLP